MLDNVPRSSRALRLVVMLGSCFLFLSSNAFGFTSCPPRLANITSLIAPCATGHYTITRVGLAGSGFSKDAIKRIAGANVAVDTQENHFHGLVGCSGGLQLQWFPYTLQSGGKIFPTPYRAEEHFDRNGPSNADNDSAFQNSIEYMWHVRSIFLSLLSQAQSCRDVSLALDFLGKALHALQDAYSHSNYIIAEQCPQKEYDQALQNGVPTNIPAGCLLTAYDAADPDYPEFPSFGGEIPDSYNHCLHAKDYPGKNPDSLPDTYLAAVQAAVNATKAFVEHLLTDISPVDFQKLANFVECPPPPCIPYYSGNSVQSTCGNSGLASKSVASTDPNDKVGLLGSGSAHYLTGAQPLRYSIYFDNLPTATAPAQTVSVTDQLIPAAVDLSTVSLGPISFIDKIITPPTVPLLKLGTFSNDVDLRPSNNLIVRISATLKPSANVLSWTFLSLDPSTLQPITDPSAGFLPPGAEGSVGFSVLAASTSTGTQITNRARVVFDMNDPIDTPVWSNTFDSTKPTSRVNAIPATQSTTTFPVSWSTSDVGAGIQDVTLYVSDNGGPFSAWRQNVTDMSVTFSGVGSHTYGFYTIARDLVGNVEAAKSGAEATTTITAPVDNTPPLIVPQISGTLGNNGWYRSNVTVTWNVSDPESGISSTTGCASTTLTNDVAGVTLSCSAMNGAGLSTIFPLGIKIDKTPPVATASIAPAPNASGWNNTSVTVSFTGTDNLSGIDYCTSPVTVTSEGTGQTVSGTCTDKAGNVSTAAVAKVNIDKTPPVIVGMPAAGCSLWPPNQKFVQVADVKASDVLSGFAPGSLKVTGTSNEAFDPNNPDIVITPDGSGGFAVQLRADRLGTGTGRLYTLSATAMDNAGNSTTATTACTVPHDQGN